MSQSQCTRTTKLRLTTVEQHLFQSSGKPQYTSDMDLIIYNSEYQVQICTQHQHAVRDLRRHLRDEHTGLTLTQRKDILALHQDDRCVDPTLFQPPAHRTLPIPGLQPPRLVLQCLEPDCARCLVSEVQMAQHCNQQHQWKKTPSHATHWSRVLAQTFFSGALTKYFPVCGVTDVPVSTVPSHLSFSSQLDQRSPRREQDLLRELTPQQQQQAQRLLQERSQANQQHEAQMDRAYSDIAKHDRTGWYTRTGWPQHFADCNLVQIAHCSRLPDQQEVILIVLVQAFNVLWHSAVTGLQTIDLETRRWLRSPKASDPDQRPLARLQTDAALERYSDYFRRLLCYTVRVWLAHRQTAETAEKIPDSRATVGIDTESDQDNSDDSDEDSVSGLSNSATDDGIGLTTTVRVCRSRNTRVASASSKPITADAQRLFPWQPGQQILLQRLYDSATDPSDTDEDRVDLLLQFFKNLIFFKIGQNQYTSSLIHFIAVLGINADTRRLRPATDFSYILAGVVYGIRILAAEALFPRSVRDSDAQYEECREGFLQQRLQYLVDGTYTPTSVLLSLLAYGKSITLAYQNTGTVSWTPDRRTIYYRGYPITMISFQQMAYNLLQRTEDFLWQQLMWTPSQTQRFTVPLQNIYDDVSITRRGYNYIQQDHSGLQDGFTWMVSRMTQLNPSDRLQVRGQWRPTRVRRYLRYVLQFWRLLLLCIHIVGGMPGRGSEMLTILFRNGLYQDRNIYLIDGCVVVVTRYHKSQSLMDKPKVIPRRLTPQLSQIVTVYLAYVQPFQEHLRYILSGEDRSDHLWHTNTGPWDTAQLTTVLQRETRTWLGRSLGTLDYRHFAISIGREVAGPIFAQELQDDDTGEEPEVEATDILEAQSGRSAQTGRNRYGVRVDMIHELSAQSLAAYRRVSELWQGFLGLNIPRSLQSFTRPTAPVVTTPAYATGHKRGLSAETLTSTPLRPRPSGLVSTVTLLSSPPVYLSPQHEHATTVVAHRRVVDPEHHINTAMHRLFGDGPVTYTSLAQQEAVRAVVANESPVVVVLPTGGGKTVLPMVSAIIDPARVIFFITPFRALTNDMVARFRRARIQCDEWTPGSREIATVLVVSADLAASYDFLTFAQLLQQQGQLQRIFVDEAHLTLTASSWRPRLDRLRSLRVLVCPLVLLTATLPPMLQLEFEDGLAIRQARYIRTSTVRPSHRYYIQHCGASGLQHEAETLCQRWQQRISRQKGIVYCRSRSLCDHLATVLSCPAYHAQRDDREAQLTQWLQYGGIILTTSALGTGVNISDITLVIHIDIPWSMIDFAQESGRGGRHGEVVDSIILVNTVQVQDRLQRGEYTIDQAAMADFVSTTHCRRWVMSEYLDGVGCGRRCEELAGGERCDRCGEGIGVLLQHERRLQGIQDRVQSTLDMLASGCTVCWVIRGGKHTTDHNTVQCQRWRCSNIAAMDRFRQQIRYGVESHSCHRCGIDQRWCASGRQSSAGCQWPQVLVPLARAIISERSGQARVRQLGYGGDFEAPFSGYGRWLSRNHARRVCGLWMSNGMAVLVRSMEEIGGGGEGGIQGGCFRML